MAFDPFGPAVSLLFVGLVGCSVLLYWRGLVRSRRLRHRIAPWRPGLFVLGLLCLLLATNAPLGPLGHSLFSVHQVDHVLLRLLGPLLIAASQPWGIFYAAFNRRLRWQIIALNTHRGVRWAGHPAVATPALIASLYVWQVPTLYGVAQEYAAVEAVAHLLMATMGLWFFAMLLDPRGPPEGARHGARLLSGLIVIVSNILLGALTTLKETVIYAGYYLGDWNGTLNAISDETMGGYTIWVPSSLIMIAAIMLVFNGWNRSEVQRWNARHTLMRQSNSAALEFPETAEELRLKVTGPNRKLGITLGIAAFAMFFVVVVTAISTLYLGR